MTTPQEVYASRVEGRKVVYLDTNAWSDITEGQTDDARAARELAVDARSRDLAIFPLAFPTINELLNREINSDSVAQADMMDQLSNGVSFRGLAHIRDAEVRAACDFMLTGQASWPKKELFTITACYISDTRVVFPESWTETEADKFMRKLQEVRSPGMIWLQQHMRQSEYLTAEARTNEKYVREISRKRDEALVWSADKSGKPNASKLRREEHECVLNRYILGSALRVTTPQEFVRLLPALARLQANLKDLGPVVAAMPSTWLSCEINVQRVLARSRRTRAQDFYDHESAILSLPYSDAFVTSDGGVLDVLRKVRASARFQCRQIRGMVDLRTYLADVLRA